MLDREELFRLQQIVIGNERFIKLGFRNEGGFVGSHDRETRIPLPDHISARHEDLDALVNGMVAFAHEQVQSVDPVIAAGILAFGFVYIHPFEDGNGRLHRYLFHHVLAQRGFNPPGVVFPISAAILERIDRYRGVLESYSARLLPLIKWQPTDSFNEEMFDMSERTIDLLFRFLHQNNDHLSARACGKEFSMLQDAETDRVEAVYHDFFAEDREPEIE